MPALSSLLPQGLPTRSLWETPDRAAWNPLWGRWDLEGQEPGSEPWAMPTVGRGERRPGVLGVLPCWPEGGGGRPWVRCVDT